MGASAQQILQSDPEYLRRQLAAQEQQRVNPTGSAAGALGALLGRGLSNVSQGKGFFQAPDYGLQRVSGVQGIMKSVQFDPNNPAEYYNQIGRALLESGYSDLAPMAFTEARKLQVQERELGARERKVTIEEEQLLLQQVDKDPYGAIERAVKLPEDDPQRAIILAGASAKIGERNTQEHLNQVRVQEAEAKTKLAEAQLGEVGRGAVSESIATEDGQPLEKRGGKLYTMDGKVYKGKIKRLSGTSSILDQLEGRGAGTDGKGGADNEGKGGEKSKSLSESIFGTKKEDTAETTSTASVRSGRGRSVSNRVSSRPPEFILRGTNRIKNKAYDEWTSKYGATHNPDGTPK
jgi:hypothetical protein